MGLICWSIYHNGVCLCDFILFSILLLLWQRDANNAIKRIRQIGAEDHAPLFLAAVDAASAMVDVVGPAGGNGALLPPLFTAATAATSALQSSAGVDKSVAVPNHGSLVASSASTSIRPEDAAGATGAGVGVSAGGGAGAGGSSFVQQFAPLTAAELMDPALLYCGPVSSVQTPDCEGFPTHVQHLVTVTEAAVRNLSKVATGCTDGRMQEVRKT